MHVGSWARAAKPAAPVAVHRTGSLRNLRPGLCFRASVLGQSRESGRLRKQDPAKAGWWNSSAEGASTLGSGSVWCAVCGMGSLSCGVKLGARGVAGETLWLRAPSDRPTCSVGCQAVRHGSVSGPLQRARVRLNRPARALTEPKSSADPLGQKPPEGNVGMRTQLAAAAPTAPRLEAGVIPSGWLTPVVGGEPAPA